MLFKWFFFLTMKVSVDETFIDIYWAVTVRLNV